MEQAADLVSRNREKQLNGLYTVGLLSTLAFVTVTFAALILVFFLRSRVAVNWHHILIPPLLWVDTAVLLASSYTYHVGHKKLRSNDQLGFHQWTVYTLAIGLLFLAGQLIAWAQVIQSGQPVTYNPHSTFFFIFSGLHGGHILVALAGLYMLMRRTKEQASGPKYQMKTRVLANAVGIFWHYLDGLWVVLFVLLLIVKR